MSTDVPRNALGAAYLAAEEIRKAAPDDTYLKVAVKYLDIWSKRDPLRVGDSQRSELKSLLHHSGKDGLVYVEHLFDAALAGDHVLHPPQGGFAHD